MTYISALNLNKIDLVSTNSQSNVPTDLTGINVRLTNLESETDLLQLEMPMKVSYLVYNAGINNLQNEIDNIDLSDYVTLTGSQTIQNKNFDFFQNNFTNFPTGGGGGGGTGNVSTGANNTIGFIPFWSGDSNLANGIAKPTGSLVGTSDTQTLTNKTINFNLNNLQNLPQFDDTSIQNKLTTNSNNITLINDRVNLNVIELINLDLRLDNAENNITSLSNVTSNNTFEINDLEVRVNEAETDITSLNGFIITNSNNISTNILNLNSLSNVVTTHTSQILAGSNNYVTVSNLVSTLSNNISNNISNISSLSNNYILTSNLVNTHSSQISTNSSSLTSLSNALNTDITNLSTLSNLYISTSNFVNTHTGQISTNSNSLSTLSNNYILTSNLVNIHTSQISTNSSSLTSLSNALNTDITNLSTLSNLYNSTSNLVNTNTANITTANTNLTTLSNALSNDILNLSTFSNNVVNNYTSLNGIQTLTNKTLTSTTNNISAKSLLSATTTIDVYGAAAPTSNQVLTAISASNAIWKTPTTGGGGYTVAINVTYNFNLGASASTANITHNLGIIPKRITAIATYSCNMQTSGITFSYSGGSMNSALLNYSPNVCYAVRTNGYTVNGGSMQIQSDVLNSVNTIFLTPTHSGTITSINSTTFTMNFTGGGTGTSGVATTAGGTLIFLCES